MNPEVFRFAAARVPKGRVSGRYADVAETLVPADGPPLLRFDTKESTYIDSLEWYHWYQVSYVCTEGRRD